VIDVGLSPFESRRVKAALDLACAIGPAIELRQVFGGCASVALTWLQIHSGRTWVNDADPSVASFWQTIVEHGDKETGCEEVLLKRGGTGVQERMEGCRRLLSSGFMKGRWWATCYDFEFPSLTPVNIFGELVEEEDQKGIALFVDPPRKDVDSVRYLNLPPRQIEDRVAKVLSETPYRWVATVENSDDNLARFSLAGYRYRWKDAWKGDDLIVSSKRLSNECFVAV
jgi:hypothetical protein